MANGQYAECYCIIGVENKSSRLFLNQELIHRFSTKRIIVFILYNLEWLILFKNLKPFFILYYFILRASELV